MAAILFTLLITGAVLAFYSININRQNKTAKPAVKTSAQPAAATEFVKGQAISFKNQVLTVKDAENREKQLKVASNASILKQKWFDANSMGTVPAEVKANDQVSVQTLKNSQGETEAISVVILTDKPKTFEATSSSGGKK